MRIRVPKYFLDFKCIADKCLDICCIGWEIDIDDEARAKYASLGGEIGKEITEKTVHGYFPLAKNGRCAFLDECGLCRIICAVGDEYLCDICREHPRYFGIGKDGIEGGIGLGCEEAARLILKSGGAVDFAYTEHNAKYIAEDEYAEVSAGVRDMIYDAIARLGARELISYCRELATVADGVAFEIGAGLGTNEIPRVNDDADCTELIEGELSEFFAILNECEALDADWTEAVTKASKVSLATLTQDESMLKSLVFYFTHRYVRECVEDMTLGYKILLALFSSLATVALSRVSNADEPDVRAAVKFSKNIEYSTENIDTITDRLSDICEL